MCIPIDEGVLIYTSGSSYDVDISFFLNQIFCMLSSLSLLSLSSFSKPSMHVTSISMLSEEEEEEADAEAREVPTITVSMSLMRLLHVPAAQRRQLQPPQCLVSVARNTDASVVDTVNLEALSSLFSLSLPTPPCAPLYPPHFHPHSPYLLLLPFHPLFYILLPFLILHGGLFLLCYYHRRHHPPPPPLSAAASFS